MSDTKVNKSLLSLNFAPFSSSLASLLLLSLEKK